MRELAIQDDKAQYVVPFILKRLALFQASHPPNEPFFIGLNGVQGAGKTVLVTILRNTLQSGPYNLSTVVFSLDDLYLTHEDQVALAKSHPDNPLLQHRGQPSTHDIPLALSVFESLKKGQKTKIPLYNKAAFYGQGDRVAEEDWEEVNTDPTNPVRVVLFEGWCVGFRPIGAEELETKHANATRAAQDPNAEYRGRLGHNRLQSVMDINQALKDYDALTLQFDAFIHIDAADPQYVYKWRAEQEEGLRKHRGSGMTEEQVKHFVDGYYPAYELYTDTLRRGVFAPQTGAEEEGKSTDETTRNGSSWRGRQLRLVIGEDRKVQEVIEI